MAGIQGKLAGLAKSGEWDLSDPGDENQGRGQVLFKGCSSSIWLVNKSVRLPRQVPEEGVIQIRTDNPFGSKYKDENECPWDIANRLQRLAIERQRVWALDQLKAPPDPDKKLTELKAFLKQIEEYALSAEENTVLWLNKYQQCTYGEIAHYLNKTPDEIRSILNRAQKKIGNGIAFTGPEKTLLIKDKDNPSRMIIIRAGGYPKKKLGRGRPGKYELKKDYDLLRKYTRCQSKTNLINDGIPENT